MLRTCRHPGRSCRGICFLLLTFTILPVFILLRRPAVPTYVLHHPYFSYDLDSEEVPDSKQICSLPRVHPFHPSVWEYISVPKPLVCSSRRGDWTYVDRRGRLKFNSSAVADSGYVVGSSLSCYWSPVFRAENEDSDLKVVYGKEAPLPEEGLTLPTSVEIVKVVCRNFASFEIYEKVHAHIRNLTLNSSSTPQHPVNVLIFGIDSLSRSAFIRLLPNTYRYLTEVLNMTVFRGMNKVGDNTYPNLIALLTDFQSMKMSSLLWISVLLLHLATTRSTSNTSFLDCSGGSGKIPRLVPHPNNCRRIFACTDGSLQEYSCPDGEVFVAKDGQCRKQDGCKKVAVLMQAYESCPEVNGPDVVLFPHPTECGMYYQCDHGVAYPRQCPKGLHYNPKLRVCDWPKNADCKARFLLKKS